MMKKAGGGKMMKEAWKAPSDTKSVPAKNSGGKGAPAGLKKAWAYQGSSSEVPDMSAAKKKVR